MTYLYINIVYTSSITSFAFRRPFLARKNLHKRLFSSLLSSYGRLWSILFVTYIEQTHVMNLVHCSLMTFVLIWAVCTVAGAVSFKMHLNHGGFHGRTVTSFLAVKKVK
jgi:hypothetical protein